VDLKSFAFDVSRSPVGFIPPLNDHDPWSFAVSTRGRGHLWAVACPDDELDVRVHEGAHVLERA
jgi:hypothetical protein